MDKISKEHRSWNMSQIKGKDTKPEKIVRSLLHRLGFRFRIHQKNLPGKPDVVLSKYNTVIFVHGCFWHRHEGCIDATFPKTRTEFWHNKFEKTKERDLSHQEALKQLGWKIIVIWECELKSMEQLENKILENLKTRDMLDHQPYEQVTIITANES